MLYCTYFSVYFHSQGNLPQRLAEFKENQAEFDAFVTSLQREDEECSDWTAHLFPLLKNAVKSSTDEKQMWTMKGWKYKLEGHFL